MFDDFSWRHIPALLAATPMLIGGLLHGTTKPREAILTYGMSEKTAASRDAQIVYYGHTMRTSTLGMLIAVFYFQRNYGAVDVTMAVMGAYCGIADVLVIWYCGNREVVPVRLLSVLAIAAWGFAGMTSEPSL